MSTLLDTASLIVTPNGYKAGKLYSVVPSSGAGDLDVTRATTATRVNSIGLIESVASNVPRLDYTNGTCPSILVEPQRTNSILSSRDFVAPNWVSLGITPNTTISPSGVQDADTLDTTIQLYQSIPVSTSTVYTISLWVKLGTATNICLVVNNQIAWNTIGGGIYNSSDGLNTTTWTRVSYTFTTPASLVFGGINFHIGANGESGFTQSSGTVFIWGAQLEAGSYATSYIPTTSASVTRNADVISKTGISSLIGQTEGTVFYDGYFGNNTDEIYLFLQATGGTTIENSIYLVKDGAGISLKVWIGTSLQVLIQGGTFTIGQRIKIAASYKQNDFILYINGTQIGTDTLGNVPTCSNLHLATYAGDPTNETFIANNGVNLSAFWKTRLTNSQLAQLTTL
jgi:hypothetical protein